MTGPDPEQSPPRICTRCYKRPIDRGPRARVCSLCQSPTSSTAKAVRGRVCQWCQETFTGKARIYCTPYCRNTANTKAKLERAGSLVPETKLCTKCGEVKEAFYFNIDTTKVDGLSSTGCRDCSSAKHREWREKPENRDRIRQSNLLRVYGISMADYAKMFESQGERCAFCQRKATVFKKRLSVDHDHNSGAIRSLACDYCNKFKISNLTLEDVDRLYEYFHNPPADKAFGERRYVPKGMEKGPKKRKQPRKKDRRKI